MEFPNFKYEQKYWQRGYNVIGVDEVGRGALAGPVHVGAVCLCSPDEEFKHWLQYKIHDSKLVPPAKRTTLSTIIKEKCCGFSIAHSDVSTINRHGIVYAVHKAVRQAVSNLLRMLPQRPTFVLLDAFNIRHIPQIGLRNQLAIIKGDQKSLSIAAASIIAKVERDKVMTALANQETRYCWEKNKGYGTKDHRDALKRAGASKLHRRLFIRKIGIIG